MANKKKAKGVLIEVPSCLEDYKLKKSTNELVISFAIDPSNLDTAKPLLNHTGEFMTLMLYIPEDQSEQSKAIFLQTSDVDLNPK